MQLFRSRLWRSANRQALVEDAFDELDDMSGFGLESLEASLELLQLLHFVSKERVQRRMICFHLLIRHLGVDFHLYQLIELIFKLIIHLLYHHNLQPSLLFFSDLLVYRTQILVY